MTTTPSKGATPGKADAAGNGGRLITAAGTIVLRPREGKKPQVLLVHRPRYDDWSLPKGKLIPDEYTAAAAVRETEEETAVTVRLGVPVDRIRYPVGGGQKAVSYWTATATAAGRHTPDAEIDKTAWLTIPSALKRMSYDDEKELLTQSLTLPRTTPLLIVRHGKAMDRKHWSGKDQLRQLNSRGRRQSVQLIPLLAAYGVDELSSSSSVRCMRTLAPYAKAKRLEVQGWSTLSEEQAKQHPEAVTTLMKRLIARTATSGVPTALCGHRPVLPLMLGALGIPDRPLQTAAVVVAHLDETGTTVAVEFHKPRS